MPSTKTTNKPHNALDAYLTKHGIANHEFARLVQQIRRHPNQPSPALVSHWRSGTKRPGHDMRVFIAVATAEAVPMESWGA